MKSLFEFENYKSLILYEIDKNKQTKGYKKKLADAAGCYPSYLSQVLNGNTHLTLDHAWGLSEFWKLTNIESEFFFTLLNYERAANPSFKSKLKDDIKRLRSKSFQIKEKIIPLGVKEAGNYGELYYSAWYYSYIHVLLSSFPGMTKESILKKVNLPSKLLDKILKDLKQINLAHEIYGEWHATENHIHLDNNSIYAQNYHNEWRMMAQANFKHRRDHDIRYSSVQTIRKEDLAEIRSQLLSLIESSRKSAQKEGDEVACILLDFFCPQSMIF